MDTGVVCLENPEDAKPKEKVTYVSCKGEYGRTYFKQVVEKVDENKDKAYVKCEYGKMLYKDRDGRDFLLGPMGGDLVKLAQLTSGTANQILNGKDVTNKPNQIFMLAKSKIPGQNLLWTKLAMNRLMFDDVQNMIAPDYQRKYKRKMQKQGRSQWWESGKGFDGINTIDFEGAIK